MAGIYIHIPFCERKCRYCDFYSEEFSGINRRKQNIDLLINPNSLSVFSDFLSREIALFTATHKELPLITSIFFGGGTPSLLPSGQLSSIIKLLHSQFNITDDAEISLEANPGTLSSAKLKSYRAAGVNRLSIGAQSFVASELNFLERIHNPRQIEEAFSNARNAGFDNISLDLMFSVPGQSKDTLAFSLERTFELYPEHISSYSLIYEPETPLYNDLQNGKFRKLNEEEDAELYEYTMDTLRQAGYIQYEVSNYALSDKYKCRHNLNYWSGGEYLAFGPSAHSYLRGRRAWNERDLNRYYESLKNGKLPIEDSELLSKLDKLNEIIMLGLRAEGLILSDLKSEFSLDLFSVAGTYIQQMIDDDFLIYDGKTLAATSKGYRVCDEIILNIISAI